MPRILGIDPSLTSTGLARVDVDPSRMRGHSEAVAIETARVPSKPTGKTYFDTALRIAAIASQVHMATKDIDLAVIEGPAFSSQGQGVHSRYWLWGKVYDALLTCNVPILVVTPNQRCKYITGKGNAGKDMVLAAAIKRWPEVDLGGNDEADALVLAAIGARHLDSPIDAVPTANWQPVMSKLAT